MDPLVDEGYDDGQPDGDGETGRVQHHHDLGKALERHCEPDTDCRDRYRKTQHGDPVAIGTRRLPEHGVRGGCGVHEGTVDDRGCRPG